MPISEIDKSRGGMVDETYVRSLTAAIKGHIRESELNAIKALHEAEVIKSEALQRWAELKEWLKEAVAQVSAGLPPDTLGYQENHPLKVTLYCNAGRRSNISVSFMEANGKIITQGGAFSASFDPQVEGEELYYMLSDSRSLTTRKISIEAMGKHILNAVANYRQV